MQTFKEIKNELHDLLISLDALTTDYMVLGYNERAYSPIPNKMAEVKHKMLELEQQLKCELEFAIKGKKEKVFKIPIRKGEVNYVIGDILQGNNVVCNTDPKEIGFTGGKMITEFHGELTEKTYKEFWSDVGDAPLILVDKPDKDVSVKNVFKIDSMLNVLCDTYNATVICAINNPLVCYGSEKERYCTVFDNSSLKQMDVSEYFEKKTGRTIEIRKKEVEK